MTALPFSPDHLVDDDGVALDDFHDLRADVFFDVVGHGDAVVAVSVHRDCSIDRLQERLFVDARDKKQALSSASGRSVLVRMHTAGNGWPTLVKKELSSGSVPLSLTTAKAFICKQL